MTPNPFFNLYQRVRIKELERTGLVTAILIDSEGDRTYLTCTHAKEIFGVDQALLVTQRFHLPRALILCDALSIESEGIAADLRPYSAQTFWSVREIGATFRALWEAGRLKTAVIWNQISKRDNS